MLHSKEIVADFDGGDISCASRLALSAEAAGKLRVTKRATV